MKRYARPFALTALLLAGTVNLVFGAWAFLGPRSFHTHIATWLIRSRPEEVAETVRRALRAAGRRPPPP